MVAPGYGYGTVAMAALGYGGPQSYSQRVACVQSHDGLPVDTKWQWRSREKQEKYSNV